MVVGQQGNPKPEYRVATSVLVLLFSPYRKICSVDTSPLHTTNLAMSSYQEHRVHNWGEKPAKENCSYSRNEVTSNKTMNNFRQEGWSGGRHQLRPQLSYLGQSWVLTNQGAAEEKDHSCSMSMGCGCNQFWEIWIFSSSCWSISSPTASQSYHSPPASGISFHVSS